MHIFQVTTEIFLKISITINLNSRNYTRVFILFDFERKKLIDCRKLQCEYPLKLIGSTIIFKFNVLTYSLK